MKKACDMGGSEAREALTRLENHILRMKDSDPELTLAMTKASDADSMVDILISLNPGKMESATSEAEEISETGDETKILPVADVTPEAAPAQEEIAPAQEEPTPTEITLS